MLRAVGGRDIELLEEMIIKRFIKAYPLEDGIIKDLISRLLILSLRYILLNHSEEENIAKELSALIYYHHLGLNGSKEKCGCDVIYRKKANA